MHMELGIQTFVSEIRVYSKLGATGQVFVMAETTAHKQWSL